MTFTDVPLGPLERAFVASLQRLEPEASEPVLLAAALCCEALANGDVCLPLERLAGKRPWPEQDVSLPPLSTWPATRPMNSNWPSSYWLGQRMRLRSMKLS